MRLARLKPRVPADFRLLSGDDATAPAFLALGGHGCISVTSNVAPGLCRSLYLACKQGQAARFERLAGVAAKLTAALFCESNPVPVKFALSQLGVMSPCVRLPLVGLSADSRSSVGAALAQTCETYSDYMICAHSLARVS